jgi:hypothetical protein
MKIKKLIAIGGSLAIAAGYPDVDVVGIIFDDEYVNTELEKQKNA